VTCKADQAAFSSRNYLGSPQPTSACADQAIRPRRPACSTR
jgi:hypothetical protein